MLPDGTQIDETEGLGNILGASYISSALVPAMKTNAHEVDLGDGLDKFYHPPFYIMYGLNGQMVSYFFYLDHFEEASCILDCNPVG